MSNIICAKNISKSYLIRHELSHSYATLRDSIAESGRRLLQSITNPRQRARKATRQEEFWALKDINFEIQPGERVGIIGRNGAGKSTLLKLLSRITEPTTGRLEIKGRVASLLEVGTGFHPELTGRENIFLNGSILGMSKTEIKRKFDDIVDFAEVAQFLDTPVKRYSSGMYVRLAFAVAAHLEPEILIVDEVLAVGDAEFQKKCIGKMKDVGNEGRTVLFVSHNMNSVEQLCTRALWLNQGGIKKESEDIRSVIDEYLRRSQQGTAAPIWENSGDEYRNPYFFPLSVRLTDRDGNSVSGEISNSDEVYVELEAEVEQTDPALTIGYAIYAQDGTPLYWSYQTDQEERAWPKLHKGRCRMRSLLPRRLLNEGEYRIELIGGLHFREWLFQPGTGNPEVSMSIRGGLSDSPFWMMPRPGIMAPVLEWEVREIADV